MRDSQQDDGSVSLTDTEHSFHETDPTTTSLMDESSSPTLAPLKQVCALNHSDPETLSTASNFALCDQYINGTTSHIDGKQHQKSSAQNIENFRSAFKSMNTEISEDILMKMVSIDNDNKGIPLQGVVQKSGRQAPRTVDLSNFTKKATDVTKTLPDTPLCDTQDLTSQDHMYDPAGIMVGGPERLEIPRWKPKSVVKWTALRHGYPCEKDAYHAAESFFRAAEEWNDAKVGVTFQWVALVEDANFIVCFGGPKGRVLARAFFPNENYLNSIFV